MHDHEFSDTNMFMTFGKNNYMCKESLSETSTLKKVSLDGNFFEKLIR